MHEVAIAGELLGIVLDAARRAGAARVRAAHLRVGRLSCIDPAALETAFEVACRGTEAEGCALVVERVAVEVACPACGARSPADDEPLGCPACGAFPVEVVAGRELRLVAIDVDDDEAAAGG